MDLLEIRLACLELTKEQGGTTEDITQLARIWAEFVLSASDAEVISAAREFSAKINASS